MRNIIAVIQTNMATKLTMIKRNDACENTL